MPENREELRDRLTLLCDAEQYSIALPTIHSGDLTQILKKSIVINQISLAIGQLLSIVNK